MASQKDYVYGLYGPDGTFTKEINTYYDDMGDYLASEAGREMAYLYTIARNLCIRECR